MESRGGKVYVNCKMQKAATTEVRPEKFGMPAARTKAMAQYMGIRTAQAHFPAVV